MDILLCNIKVISLLQPTQKLYVSEKHLVIDDQYQLVSTVTRWWYNETRDKTLLKIQEIIQEAIHHGNNAIRSELIKNDKELAFLENSDTNIKLREWEIERDKITSLSNINFLNYLVEELTNMIKGINILKDTYGEDITLCSKLDIEIQNINTNIEKFSKFLN